MPNALRRIVLISAGLLMMALLAWYRLSAFDLKAYLAQASGRFPTAGISVESARPSLLPVPGLHLTGVHLQAPYFTMDSGHVDVAAHLLPLLLGKFEISKLIVHQGSFRLSAGRMIDMPIKELARLPMDQIRLMRCRLMDHQGHILLDKFDLDVRDIGPNKETLWELQAQQDIQSLQGFGRLAFRGDEIISGFGKLKLDHVAAGALRPFAPSFIARRLLASADEVSGALTLDISGKQAWSVFGEMSLNGSGFKQPLRLRGKFARLDAERLEWRDGFLHFGDAGSIALEGECTRSGCQSSIDAKAVPLAFWRLLLPGRAAWLERFTAESKLQGRMHWRPEGWLVDARLQLENPAYHNEQTHIPLPDIDGERLQASGDKASSHISAVVRLGPGRDRLDFDIASNAKEQSFRLRGDRFPHWAAWTNILLDALHVAPDLAGSGSISGSIEWRRHASERALHVDIDATDAAIRHPLLDKPRKVAARCKLDLRWRGADAENISDARFHRCQLHTSRLVEAHWERDDGDDIFKSKDVEIDFDALRRANVRLPNEWRRFHGRLSGAVSSRWHRGSLWSGVERATGHLQLQRFGAGQWRLGGVLDADHGGWRSEDLLVEGSRGFARLQGSYDAANAAGRIHVLSASLDWSDLPEWPESWRKLRLSGHIRNAELRLLRNSWKDISGEYSLSQQTITIQHMRASLAGGMITSPILKLQPIANGLGIAGKLRANAIALDKLAGLEDWLKGRLQGSLYANVLLNGALPALDPESWRGSNGDIIIYNGAWTPADGAIELSAHAHRQAPPIHAFRKLEGRFRVFRSRIDVQHLRLQQGKRAFQGGIRIDRHGEVSGRLDDRRTTYRLDGRWPALRISIQQ